MKSLVSAAAATGLLGAMFLLASSAGAHIPDRCQRLLDRVHSHSQPKVDLLNEIQDIQIGGALIIQLTADGYQPKSKDIADALMPYAEWINTYIGLDGNAAEALKRVLECIRKD